MTRFWPNGETILMTLGENGDPCLIRWNGEIHSIQHIANRWRVDERWWAKRVHREYFKLTTDTGCLMIIYQDMLTGGWFLHRLYD